MNLFLRSRVPPIPSDQNLERRELLLKEAMDNSQLVAWQLADSAFPMGGLNHSCVLV